MKDLIWKLLLIAFVYMATRVPSAVRRLAAHPLLRHETARLDGALGAVHRARTGRDGGGGDGRRGRACTRPNMYSIRIMSTGGESRS